MGFPNISNGHSFPGYDNDENDDELEDEEAECDAEDEDDQQQQQYAEGPRVRRRKLGNGTRLPSLAELDRSIAADFAAAASSEGGGFIKQEEQQQQQTSRRIKHEHDRRGSGCSGGSRRSR